ncbi:hypothetical protein Tco_1077386 [Tanacetum coccineum]
MEEFHKLLIDQVDDAILRYNVSKPLSSGGDPGHVTIQPDFFFNKDLEYLRQWVLHDQHTSEVIAGLYDPYRILSVVRIEVFLMSLNHLSPKDKKILTTAVNLWTRNLVIRQRVEDFQLGIESYQTQLNLTKPRWDAKGFEYKHDFTVIDSPRAVTFRASKVVTRWIRGGFNEIHKFSNGTLHQIDEALDYRVKEFRVNRRNPGLDTRFWTKKDIDRSKNLCLPYKNDLR